MGPFLPPRGAESPQERAGRPRGPEGRGEAGGRGPAAEEPLRHNWRKPRVRSFRGSSARPRTLGGAGAGVRGRQDRPAERRSRTFPGPEELSFRGKAPRSREGLGKPSPRAGGSEGSLSAGTPAHVGGLGVGAAGFPWSRIQITTGIAGTQLGLAVDKGFSIHYLISPQDTLGGRGEPQTCTRPRPGGRQSWRRRPRFCPPTPLYST